MNPFYAFDTCFFHVDHTPSFRERAAMLKELGFAGSNHSMVDDRAWETLPEWLEELERQGLRLLSIWVSRDVAAAWRDDDRVLHAIKQLAGHGTIIELALRSGSAHDQPSSPRADGRAAELIHHIADAAASQGLRVALYPHTHDWLERVEDAVRLAMRVNRENVGVTFNLHHWLCTDGEQLDARLHLALPKAWNVSVNGATVRGLRDGVIETLDRGSYDVAGFLAAVERWGYAGPISLQGWGVRGDAYDNLKRSMGAYRRMMGEGAPLRGSR